MLSTNLINLFNTLFYISLGLAALGLVLAAFFFFYFDIRTVRALMTGSAKRKAIEQMNEQNSRTGKLRTSVTESTSTKNAPIIQNPSREDTADIGPTHVTYEAPDAQETTILHSSEEDEGAGETSILGGGAPQPAVRFELTENTVVIHTNEFI